MCGIFGSINKGAMGDTYSGLKQLEYRGYDSFGFIAVRDGRAIVERSLGPLDRGYLKGAMMPWWAM